MASESEGTYDNYKTLQERKPMRNFPTGATRDTDLNKIDYWGFISPKAMRSFGEYMMKHQKQADGRMRDSDNWKRGIPMDAYLRSMFRHMMDLKAILDTASIDRLEGYAPDAAIELMNAILFNVQGWLHEAIKVKENSPTKAPAAGDPFFGKGPDGAG